MKKPSVPCRAGVRSSVSSLPSAEAGGSPPTPRGPRLAPGQRRKLRMVREEGGDLVAVLLRQHRAGGVDEPAAGLDQRRRQRRARRAARPARWARLAGFSRHLASGRRRQAPRARAGGVDEHQVESGAERGQRRLVAGAAAPGHCARRPASAARRSGAGAPHRRRRRRSGRCCAWRRRTPASCRRRLHKYRAPAARGPAPAISAAICEPSSCTSYQPLPVPGLGLDVGLPARPVRGRQPDADRRQRRRLGGEARQRLQHLLAVGLEGVDAQVDRRPAGQRRAFLGRAPRRRRARTTAPASPGSRRARRPAHRRAPRAASAGLLGLAQRLERMRRAVGAGDHGVRRQPQRARGGGQRQRARGCRRPSARPATGGGAARRRRGCRWRRGRPSRRSGGLAPVGQRRAPPGGAGPGPPRAPRWRP